MNDLIVEVGENVVGALDEIARRDGITVAQAVARAVDVYHHLRAHEDQGCQLQMKGLRGEVTEITLP